MFEFHKFKENKFTYIFLLINVAILLTAINCKKNLKKNVSFLSAGESNKIIAKYNIDSITEEPVLLFNLYLVSYIDSRTLNDEKITIDNKYNFKKIGKYELKITKDLNKLDDLFRECLSLKEVDFFINHIFKPFFIERFI